MIESTAVGANLIYSYSNNVSILKNLAAQQLNLLTQLNSKHNEKKNQPILEVITEEEAIRLKLVDDQLRGVLQLIFYDYDALAKEFQENDQDVQRVTEAWETVQYSPHIERKLVNALVKEYNRVIVKKVCRDFFKTAEDTITKFQT